MSGLTDKIYDAGPDRMGDSFIPLHRNENLFVDRSFLQELAEQAIKEVNFSSYPDSASLSLRKAIGESYGYAPEEVYVGNGADGVLSDLLLLLREDYEEVGTQPITYRVYPYLFNRYKFKQKLFTETSGLWVIDSPNSITGETFDFSLGSPEFLIWDNVYGEYMTDSIPEEKRALNQVRIRSFSKFYALASLRIGYCFARRDLVSRLLRRKDVFNVNGLAQKMGELVLRNRKYFESLIPKMKESKKKLTNGLHQMGFSTSAGIANFVWATHPYLNMNALEKELRQASLVVRRFDEPLLENFIRITVPPLATVDLLLNVIKMKI